MPPRSLLLTTDAVGGVWQYSCTLAREFRRFGVECTLAVLGPPPSETARAEADGLVWVATGLDLDWMVSDAGALRGVSRRLVAVAQELRADAVHLHSPAYALEPFECPCVAVVHSCVGTWWRAQRRGPLPADLAWRTQALAAGARHCDALIAPTAALATQIEAVYGTALSRLEIVPNGIPPAPDIVAGRESVILSAGRIWDEAKGMRLLDAVAARIALPVRVAGPLHGPANAGFVPQHMQPLGVLSGPNLRCCMASAALFASPARYEPFGLAVLEAASLGTPLLLSDIPTFRELWEGAALFLPADDPTVWAECIGELMADPATRFQLGAAARRRALCFTADSMARRTLHVHALARRDYDEVRPAA